MCIRYIVIISSWNRHDPSFEQFLILFTHWCSIWNWSIGSWKRGFEIYCYFLIKLLSWKREWSLTWTNLNSISISSMYFNFFVIIIPWKMAWPFSWTNLNSLHCWPEVLEEKAWGTVPSGRGQQFTCASPHTEGQQIDCSTGSHGISVYHITY